LSERRRAQGRAVPALRTNLRVFSGQARNLRRAHELHDGRLPRLSVSALSAPHELTQSSGTSCGEPWSPFDEDGCFRTGLLESAYPAASDCATEDESCDELASWLPWFELYALPSTGETTDLEDALIACRTKIETALSVCSD
jgi:hypothetical protein